MKGRARRGGGRSGGRGRGGKGPAPIDKKLLRTHPVSSKYNEAELALLDQMRGPFQRGAYQRMAVLGAVPPQVPILSQKLWGELAELEFSIEQIVAGGSIEDSEEVECVVGIMGDIKRLRVELIGAVEIDESDEGLWS